LNYWLVALFYVDGWAQFKAINLYLFYDAAAQLQHSFCLKQKMRAKIVCGAKEVGDKKIVWEMGWYNGGGWEGGERGLRGSF